MIQICGLNVEPIIGMEIHVQLATRTKMFCGCVLEFGAEPNSRTCPVCLGLPGSLPVINRTAVELSIRTALALQCRIAAATKWDRKSYFYPDLPKNYQISQYDQPLAEHGFLEIPHNSSISKIRIRRAHLEEDAGKNVHDFPGFSAIDLNRAGTPLLEIVTEPDLRSAEEAREFSIQLHRLVGYLGVSEANMQKGQMRFEPNINVKIHKNGEEFRTPIVEVKNLNSFRSVQLAIEFEIQRQVEQWLADGRVARAGNKSNRGWDDGREITLPQREKEEANDYRYFPDPDLTPVIPNQDFIAAIVEDMPELPACRTERFVCEFKLPPKDAPALVDDRVTADLLDAAAEANGDKVTLGKHFLSFWARHANERGVSIGRLGATPEEMAELSRLVCDGQVNATAAAQIVDELMRQMDGSTPRERPADIAQRIGLMQSRDEGQIQAWVEEALAANAKAVQDALANPKKIQAARGFLTGQVMKISGGKADPKIVGQLIEKKLAESLPAAT